MKREAALDTIYKAVCKDRQASYGSPENSFNLIAQLWSSYLAEHAEGPLKTHDVAVMMALLKAARIAFNPQNQDNWIDLGGYAVCGAELAPPPNQGEFAMPVNTCNPANVAAMSQRLVDVGEAIALSRIAHKMKQLTVGKFTKEQMEMIDRAILQPQAFTFAQFMEVSNYIPQ